MQDDRNSFDDIDGLQAAATESGAVGVQNLK